ncbi:unnamed protein product [Calicophoron daubneyi]|uniref:Inositol polyphosphate-related phosphatase domain-containing protein n=1 Tax=Calicophoron daubneyi TaxID=300641 RepID=A0AAV2TVU5_CALDB
MPSLTVRCCTWNVGDMGPPDDDLHALLGITDSNMPDIIGVCLQEVVAEDMWRKVLIDHLHPKDYVLAKARNCWAIWIFLFVKRSLLPAITNIESEVTPSGFGGVMGNKGGVSARFEVCGVNVILLSCHFSAHAEKKRDRLNDYLDIIEHQSFRDEDVNVILDHDYIFWMGDLNFRLDGITKAETEKLIREKRYAELLKHDQLLSMKNSKLIFQDFQEGEIKFPPTFKFDKGTDTYDTSAKQRIPSWTDRILFLAHRDFAIDHHLNVDPTSTRRSPSPRRHVPVRGSPSTLEKNYPRNQSPLRHHRGPAVDLIEYTCLPQYKSSDHRPVVGTFQISVPSRWFSLPVQFIEPTEKEHGALADLKFTYAVMNPPGLLRMTEVESILSAKPSFPASCLTELVVLSSLGRSLLEETVAAQDTPVPLAPAPLEVGTSDWIGVYPADFEDLEKSYATYVYAPSTVTSAPRSIASCSTKNTETKCYSGTVPFRYLSELQGKTYQLVYMSHKKNCPQGYSAKFTIKK